MVLEHPGGSLTSDGRLVATGLRKLECANCRLVRNADALDECRLEEHYESYALGIDATAGEPLFFTEHGPIHRSQVIGDWIVESVLAVTPRAPATVLEIGCGEGSVLARIARYWPSAVVTGVDLSAASIELARVKGLTASKGSYRAVESHYDLIYSFAVIEHVPSPMDYLVSLKAHLNPGGLLLVAQPCQDYGSNDVFFSDHLFHFQSDHLRAFAQRADLVERYRSVGHALIPDFSLHVFAEQGTVLRVPPAGPVAGAVSQAIAAWQAIFADLDCWLGETRGRPLMVWGLGQTFQMMRAYSRLNDHPVAIGLDDNAARFAGNRLPFPVMPLESTPLDASTPCRVLLTFRPGSQVVDRLRARRLDYFSPLPEPPQ